MKKKYVFFITLLLITLVLVAITVTKQSRYLLLLFAVLAALSSSLDSPFSAGGVGMIHLAVITAFLTVGLAPAIHISLAGFLLAGLLSRPWSKSAGQREPLLTVMLNGLVSGLALLVSGQIYLLAGSHDPVDGWTWPGLLPIGLLLGCYALLRHTFLAAALWAGDQSIRHYYRLNAWQVVSQDLLLLPLAVGVAAIYLQMGPLDFMAFCSLWVGLPPLLRRLGQARRRQLEKLIQELHIIYEMGQAVTANLDLNKLIETLYHQVSRLIQADNFYIALYDSVSDELSFPIVYEKQERRHYTSRRLSNGLCEHVIRSKQALLIRWRVKQKAKSLGLETVGRPPACWLGVPLIAGDSVLGVMVVQSFVHGGVYNQDDQRTLTMLASQAAIAIENARLYGHTQQRAGELALLNTFSTAVSATLNIDRVLHIVISSIKPVAGCRQAAVYLLDSSNQQLALVASQGLGENYKQHFSKPSLLDNDFSPAIPSRRMIVVPDIALDERFSDEIAWALEEDYRAIADIPLVAQEELIGILRVYYDQVHHFDLVECDLLMTFGNQAAVAIANARLYKQTDQALARRVEELSAIEQIGRELVSTRNPQKVIDMVLEKAVSATGATQGSVAMLDESEQALSLVALTGYTPELDQTYQSKALPVNLGIAGRVLRSGQVMLVSDVTQDDTYFALISTVRSQLSAPIVREGKVIGTVNLESDKLAGFDDQDARFVAQLALQAAVALENAQLFQQANQRVQELSQLYQAGLDLTSSMELGDVLNIVSHTAQKITGSDIVTFYLYDSMADSFTQVSAQGYRVMGSVSSEIRPTGLTRTIIESRGSLRIDDTLSHSNVNPSVIERGVRSVIGVPVVSRGQVLGVLFVNSLQANAYTVNDERLVQALAFQSGAVAANVRLFNQVREAHDQLQAILNSTRDGILMLDNLGRIVMVNKALETILGISRKALTGYPIETVVKEHQETLQMTLGIDPTSLREWAVALQTQPTLGDNREFRSQGPQRRYSKVSSFSVVDQANTVIGQLLVFRDVTEEKELQEIRENLTGMIIHDLRSPLTAVLGGLKLIEETALDEETDQAAQHAMQIAQRSCNNLLMLIDSLLDISQLEIGGMPLERFPAPLAPLVHSAISRLAPLAVERGVILRETLPKDIPLVVIDEDKINRVFINLIDNALKFSPTGGQVVITASVIQTNAQRLIQCNISDDGPGIPDEFKEKIFDRFMQVRDHTYKGQQGTGLGLAFCKLAVEAHGGSIWVQDRPKGGSLFQFTIPIADPGC